MCSCGRVSNPGAEFFGEKPACLPKWAKVTLVVAGILATLVASGVLTIHLTMGLSAFPGWFNTTLLPALNHFLHSSISLKTAALCIALPTFGAITLTYTLARVSQNCRRKDANDLQLAPQSFVGD